MAPTYKSFKIFCKRNPSFCLTIREKKVILAPSNDTDEAQHWYKDDKKERSYALINKSTHEAIKHSPARSAPVELATYDPNDETLLWVNVRDLDDGYKGIRMGNDSDLWLDAEKNQVFDGTLIISHPWNGGDNQRWIIEEHNLEYSKIYCKRGGSNFPLAIRECRVLLVPDDSSDDFQYWYKVKNYNNQKDDGASPNVAFVNKASGQAIKHPVTSHNPVLLASYNPLVFDESVQWIEGLELEDGYKSIRFAKDADQAWDAVGNDVVHGTHLINYPWHDGENQKWKIESS